MKIDHIDHLVLTVKNIDETCAFYQAVMGLEVVTFGQGRKALKFGRQKLNLQQQGNEFEPKAAAPTPGAIDLCFITGTPIHTVRRELEEKGILLEDGPVERTGAVGKLLSVYLRDPDRNLIEIANHTSE
jgi:catechol 2,3-dioxygenase-like lactoylglutathione lyase family enzyme